MVFKRRDRRPFGRAIAESLWPRGGWTRAFRYVKHRVRRLPDPPHRIARGIFVGVFVTFTPLFGLHFVVAALLAWIVRGNILAALFATFVGNPLTFLPIAAISLETGHLLLGRPINLFDGQMRKLGQAFVTAWEDLRQNVIAWFTPAEADWSKLAQFFDAVFLPYLLGGILPGLLFGTLAYAISLPVIEAYQKRRKGALKAKLQALRDKAKAAASGDPAEPSD